MLNPSAAIKMQQDGLFRVSVDDAFHELADRNFNPQFLTQFARQALFKGLARLAFSAWEFPQPAEMPLGRPLGNKESPVAKHQTRSDLDVLGPLRHRPMLL